MSATVAPLLPYPCARARASLPPSQHAAFYQTVSSALAQTLDLPPAQRDTAATRAFISSYAKDTAQEVLQSLIWEEDGSKSRLFQNLTKVERSIRHRVFLLAERQAAVGSLNLQVLLDLSVAYGSTNSSRLRSLFSSAVAQNQTVITEVRDEAIPALINLLSTPTQGLYGLRKTVHILLCLLRPAPPELVREFARNKAFVLALAKAYDGGLASFSQSYGGLRLEARDAQSAPLDEWERVFLETKVALIDSFHILVRVLLADVAAVPSAGPALATQCELAFDVVFALLELPASRATGSATPFLDRTLLADYQHAYDLSNTLNDALRRADDARTELLETALRELDSAPSGTDTGSAGALKLLISSSGVPPGIDNVGRGPARSTNTTSKGKGKAPTASLEDDGAFDIAVSQVLDIFPDKPPDYLRFLLSHADYPYRGNAEKLIEALLEGTAPEIADVEAQMGAAPSGDYEPQLRSVQAPADDFEFTKDRMNVFDAEEMDISHLRIGKKRYASNKCLAGPCVLIIL